MVERRRARPGEDHDHHQKASVPAHGLARRRRRCRPAVARQHGSGTHRAQSHCRGAGVPARRLLRAERDGNGLLDAADGGWAGGSVAAYAGVTGAVSRSAPACERSGRRVGRPRKPGRRSRPRIRHVSDGRAVRGDLGLECPRGRVHGSGRRPALRRGDAVGLARAGSRFGPGPRGVRRRELRLDEHARVAHADHAAALRERSARRLRAALRHERQHRRGDAARPHPPGPQHARFRERADRGPGAGPGSARPRQAGRVPRVGTGRRAAPAEGRGAELAGAPRGRPADGDPQHLRRARHAHDGFARAGVPDRPDPRQHVHAGARGQRPGLSRDRRAGLASPVVASHERAGEDRAPAQDQHVSRAAVRPPGREAAQHAGRRRGRCWTARCSSTVRGSATATRIFTTICRSRWWVDLPARARGAATSAIRRERRSPTSG